jgi:hypothetical protein
MRDHSKLRAFKLADEVALLVYKSTRSFLRGNYSGCLGCRLLAKTQLRGLVYQMFLPTV